MYDCSWKEGVFIVVLECRYLSVCQRVDVSGLPTVWCEIIGGWDYDKVMGDLVQHDKATGVTLYNMTRRLSMRL